MKILPPDEDFSIFRQFLTVMFERKLRKAKFETWVRSIAEKPETLFLTKGPMKHPAISLIPTVALHSPHGHFFNPVVDPTKVHDYVFWSRKVSEVCCRRE